MDAGERWTLADVAGQVRYTWNSRQHQVQSAYDVLRRPTDTMVTDESGRQRTVVRIDYGESHADAAARNLRGRSYRTCDASGVIIAEAYDFKGNLTRSTRQLAADYRETLDWSAPVALETDIFTSSTTFDALNRPVTLTMPDGSIIRPSYNEARLPEAIDVNIRGEMADGQPVWSPAVLGIDYNAKGQRVRLALGNGAVTICEHDPLTFRLIRLDTSRDGRRFQDLHYTYDPAGNVISVEDRAQPEIFFRNTAVGARGDYLYDAIYQLIEATGREHLGQQAGPAAPPRAPAAFDGWHTNLPQPGDGQAMGRYTERYAYDRSGNLLSIRHLGSDPTQSGWTRSYEYAEPGAIDPAGVPGNRLTSSRVGDDEIERLTYDPHGNMTSMGHLPLMQWNFADQLIATASQVVTAGTPEITWYVYDASGQRVRKITDRQTGAGGTPTRRSERIYLGGLEIHREYGADGVRVDLERETLHVMDGAQRLALIETRTRGDDGSPRQLMRYQFGNHLDSASLELSGEGEVISYEEYYPYGASSYQAVSAGINAVAKRYRYGAKERDEETGLSYFGLRYHAGWLGRWTAADPAGIGDGLNLCRSHANNPIRFTDPDGGAILDQLSNIAYGVGGGIASKASGVWEGATALGAAAYNDPVGLGTTMLKESLPGKVLTGNFSGAFTDVKEEVGYALGNAGNLVIAPYLARQYAGTLATGSQAEIQAATEKGIDDVAGMIDTGSDIVSFGVKAGVKIAAKKGIIEGVSVALAAAVVSVPDAPPPRRQLSFALDRPEGPTRFDVHPIGTVAEHPVVVVTSGDTAQAFYKRSGEGSKGTAKEGLSGADAARPMGAVVDDWAPFDGWTIKEEWFNKTRFNTENVRDYFDVEIPLPLDRWGSFLNYRVNEALLGMEAEFLPQLKQMTTAAATEAFSTHGLSLPPLQTKMQAAMEALRAGHSLDWARRE
jgi:RHS repeat-associated protein